MHAAPQEEFLACEPITNIRPGLWDWVGFLVPTENCILTSFRIVLSRLGGNFIMFLELFLILAPWPGNKRFLIRLASSLCVYLKESH